MKMQIMMMRKMKVVMIFKVLTMMFGEDDVEDNLT